MSVKQTAAEKGVTKTYSEGFSGARICHYVAANKNCCNKNIFQKQKKKKK